ncbi:uncharacterized protein LOC116261699 isoform X4 [Nymphaea colorata]|uniref:uncharacterized protein LOC116261699 isoform X4 n=1 Tax=Nymphaea colorata TaxID=210225 RepID=UPI00129EA1C0|nr:uncharacterized protein LOC116261699 isoform X4 [Nymphaea colorata]
MPRTDPAWKHCVEEDPDDKEKRGNLRCNYCKDIFRGGVARMKEHLAGTRKGARPCNDAPQEVVQFFVKYLQSKKSGKEQKKANLEFAKNEGLSKGLAGANFTFPSTSEVGSSKTRGPMDQLVNSEARQATTDSALKEEERKKVCFAIGRFLFAHGLPLSLCNSLYFEYMCEAIANYGSGFEQPSYHEMRTWILKEEIDRTQIMLEDKKKTWSKTGCSIMVDGWTDDKSKNLTNFLVDNPSAYWWNTFGDETKELKNFAMRILNLTCSASGCERNWSTFSMVHTKKRNRLEQERLNALVFVMYNLKLKERDTRRKSMGDPLCLDNIDSDDEWIVEKEDPVFPPSSLEDSWLDLTFNVDDINIAPFGVSPRSTQKRKRDSSSKKMQVDKGKRKQGDSENENVDDEKIGEEDESIKYMDDSNEDELSTSDEHNIDEHII